MTCNNPKISIIVPVYKVEKYLSECIDSILLQSFKDFELILVDDESPDNSGSICDVYTLKDERIKVIHQKNTGQAGARNKGIEISSAPILTFVDSDDVLATDALEILYMDMQKSDADIILGKMQRFVVGQGTRPYTHLEGRKEMSGYEALILILQGKYLNISLCGGLYKREVFHNIQMPIGYICEDWYITPSLYFQAKTVIFNPTLWYLYRDNPMSTMGILSKQCNLQIIDVAKFVINQIKQKDRELYIITLWSNLKRIWKYVGIIYYNKRQKEEELFLNQVRDIIKYYWKDLLKSDNMKVSEKIGVYIFCYCNRLCEFMYFLKSALIVK